MPINDIRNNIVNNLIIIGVDISTPAVVAGNKSHLWQIYFNLNNIFHIFDIEIINKALKNEQRYSQLQVFCLCKRH